MLDRSGRVSRAKAELARMSSRDLLNGTKTVLELFEDIRGGKIVGNKLFGPGPYCSPADRGLIIVHDPGSDLGFKAEYPGSEWSVGRVLDFLLEEVERHFDPGWQPDTSHYDHESDDESAKSKSPQPEKPPEKPKLRFPLVRFSELQIDSEEDEHAIDGIIPRTGLVVIWGPPKCGKSFSAFDMFLHVALNWTYRGHKVTSGPIVYCAFEGAKGFKKRAAGFRQHHSLADNHEIPFYLSPARMDFIRDHKALIKSISDEVGDAKPVAVVLDTLNRSLVGSESKDVDMAAYLAAADAVRETFGCVVVIVHHSGIETNRPRGHTSLTGAVDAQLRVERDDNDNVILTVEYQKDGEEGEVLVSRLEQISVGKRPDGTPITSCVVISGDPAVAEKAKPIKTKSRPSKTFSQFRDALVEAIGSAGFDHRVRGDGPIVRAVEKHVVRSIHKKIYVPSSDGDPSEAERKAWDYNFKTAFRKGLFMTENADGKEILWAT